MNQDSDIETPTPVPLVGSTGDDVTNPSMILPPGGLPSGTSPSGLDATGPLGNPETFRDDITLYEAQIGSREGLAAAALRHAIGRVAEDRLAEPVTARAAYQDAVAGAVVPAASLRALRRLAVGDADLTQAVALLSREIEATTVASTRASLLVEKALILAEGLLDPEGARGAAEAALAAVPGHRGALAALERVALAGADRVALAAVLEAQLEAAGKPAERCRCLARLGLLAEAAGRDAEALAFYGRVLDEGRGGEAAPVARAGLLRMGLRLGRTPEVVRALREEGDAARAGARRGALRLSLAALLRERVGEEAHAVQIVASSAAEIGDDPEVLAILAAARSREGRHDEALALADRRAALAGDDGWATWLLVRAAAQAEASGDLDGAGERLLRALERSPGSVSAQAGLERLALRRGDAGAQLAAAARAVDRAAAPAERAAQCLRAAELAEVALDDREAALGWARRALEAVADHGPALVSIERLCASLGRWAELADVLAQPGPTPARRLRLAAVCQDRLGDPGRALRVLHATAPDASDGKGQFDEAAVLAAAELADDALVAAQAALALAARVDGDARVAWLHRAATLYEERGVADEEAERTYAAILDVAPGFQPALEGLARVLVRRADIAGLAQVLERQAGVVLAAPPSPGTGPSWAAGLLAEAARLRLDVLADGAGSLASAQRALEIEPGHVGAHDLRVRALELSGRHEDLAAALGALADVLPDGLWRAAVLRRQAELLEWRLLRPREALVAIDRALTARPSDEPCRLVQQRLFQVLGRHAEAASREETRLLGADDVAPGAFVELATRVAEPARVLALLGRALDEDPRHLLALELLDAIAARGNDAKEAALACLRRAEATTDGDAARVLFEAASLRWLRSGIADPRAQVARERALAIDDPASWPGFEAMARAAVDLARLLLLRKAAVEAALTAPERALALWELALGRIESRDLRGAAADLDRALQMDADFLPALRDRLRLAEALAEPDVMVTLSRRLVDGLVVGPAWALGVRDAVAGLLRVGRQDQALRLLDVALARRPEADDLLATYEELQRRSGGFAALADALTRHLGAATGLAVAARKDANVRLAHLLADDLDRPADAVAPLRAALALDGHDAELATWLAELLADLQRPAEAIEVLRAMIAHVPSPAALCAAWVRIGSLAADALGDHTAAAGAFRQALLVEPGHRVALRGLWQSSVARRDFGGGAQALRGLADGEQRGQARAEHLRALGDLLAGPAGDPDAAVTAWEQAIDADPWDPAALERLDGLLTESGKAARLVAVYERALRLVSATGADPHSAATSEVLRRHLRLAALLSESVGDGERAVAELRKAVALRPDDPRPRVELARLLGGVVARPQDAIVEHLALLRIEPFRIASLRALRDLFAQSGDDERAGRVSAVLSVLKATDADDDRRLRSLRAQPPVEPVGTVVAFEFDGVVRHPDERHPATDLLAEVVDMLPKLYPIRIEDWGVGKQDKLGPRSDNPVRALADRLAAVLGVSRPFDVWVSPDRVRDVEVDAVDPPALIVSARLASLGPAEVLTHLGRQLARLRARTHGVGRLELGDLEVLLAGAVRVAVPGYGRGLAPEATLDDLARRIDRLVARRQRRAFEQLATAVADGEAVEPSRWRAGMELTALRGALVVSGDLRPLLDHVVRTDAALKDLRANDLVRAITGHAMLADLVSFALSPELADLRRRLLRPR